MFPVRNRTFWELHLVHATRATSTVIAEAYTLSLEALGERSHFEEVALVKLMIGFRDGCSDVAWLTPASM
jgi:hypothetical protein